MGQLADIVDDISFETLGGGDETMYVGIRADGTMDLGVGNEGGATVHFSHRDVEAIDDAAFALWRQRGNDPAGDDEALFGLIDDTIVDTEGGRIYLAISQKQTHVADPDDEDDEDEFGPVLTVGIPTAKDTEDNPDFHELDLDEDGFDNLIENLQRLAGDNPPAEVETEGAGPIDVTLMADHTIHLIEGDVVSDPPTLRVDEADQLAAAIERLLKVDVPDTDGDPDTLDGEDINDDLRVSLNTDGTFSVLTPLGYWIEFERDDAEQLADSLRTLVRRDRALPGGGGIPARSGGSGEASRSWAVVKTRMAIRTRLLTSDLGTSRRHLPGKHDQSSHGRKKGVKAVKAVVKSVAKKAAKAVVKGSAADVFAGDFSGLQRVGKQSGANPGGVFEAGDGSRWYVKAQKSAEHAQNERLAAALYGAADVAVPELFVGSGTPGLPDGVQTATRYLDGALQDLRLRTLGEGDQTYLARIREGFAVDALLANWDVAGENPAGGWDNIVSVGDTPWRIDVGGALAFRGLGKPKGDAFGPSVTEWDKFRDPDSPRASAAVFRDITPEQLEASVERVKKLTPAKIRSVVKANGGDPTLAELLIARRKDLLSRHKAETKKPKPATSSGATLTGKAALEAAPLDNADRYLFAARLEIRAGLTVDRAYELWSSVSSYQDGQYGPINQALLKSKGSDFSPEHFDSGYDAEAVPEHIGNVDLVMEHSRLTADVVVYRGERNPSRNFPPGVWSNVGGMEGAEWTFYAYASTSTKKSVAKSFATKHVSPGGQPTVMKILARKGTPAIAMTGIDEDELLLTRGLRYRVTNDHGVISGVRMLDVEVIA